MLITTSSQRQQKNQEFFVPIFFLLSFFQCYICNKLFGVSLDGNASSTEHTLGAFWRRSKGFLFFFVEVSNPSDAVVYSRLYSTRVTSGIPCIAVCRYTDKKEGRSCRYTGWITCINPYTGNQGFIPVLTVKNFQSFETL